MGGKVSVSKEEAELNDERIFWRRIIDEMDKSHGWVSEEDAKEVFVRIRRGVPTVLRGSLWTAFCLARPLIAKNDGCFDVISSKKLDGGERKYIKRDLQRTFPYHPDFSSSPGSNGQDHLESVLCAYAAFNGKIGYCQGINFITGTLLLHMPPSQAFWTLVSLLNRKPDMKKGLSIKGSNDDVNFVYITHGFSLMDGFFVPGTPKLQMCLYVLDSLVKWKLPQVAEHFRAFDISAVLYASEFFLTAFSGGMFPLLHVEHVWDCVFVHGSWVLHAIALVVLTVLQPKILSATSFETIVNAIRNFGAIHLDHTGSTPTTFASKQIIESNKSNNNVNGSSEFGDSSSDPSLPPPSIVRLTSLDLIGAALDMRGLRERVLEIEDEYLERNGEEEERNVMKMGSNNPSSSSSSAAPPSPSPVAGNRSNDRGNIDPHQMREMEGFAARFTSWMGK